MVPAAGAAGTTAVTVVELTTVTLVPALVPKVTPVTPVRFVPVIVTVMPAAIAVGENEVTPNTESVAALLVVLPTAFVRTARY